MGGTLTEQRRVNEEGFWIAEFCCRGRIRVIGNDHSLTVPYQKATANYVPAAAVIRRWRALSGFIGRKGCVGGCLSLWLKRRAQPYKAMETEQLECSRGKWNSMCSGKMRRYMEEHQWRRRLAGLALTLRHESVGSK